MSNLNLPPLDPIGDEERQFTDQEQQTAPEVTSAAERLWNQIMHLGLGETTLKVMTGVASVVLVLLVVLVMSKFYLSANANAADITPDPEITRTGPSLPVTEEVQPALYSSFGVSRLAQIHTTRPSKPRLDVSEYEIVQGDTLFGIAEKFGLKPETLLWSNRHILGDNPHNIFPGIRILIPPFDGAIYQWNTGDGLNGVSKFYNVTPDVIIDWAGNDLDRSTLGDLSLPNIPAGTLLFVPNGKGEFTDWLERYTREEPAVSSISGGSCGVITEGYIGNGTFIWPTTERYLSGYDYTPETNHRGIDIAGKIGNPIYAVDGGVVVYSNWNTNGYGNLIVVDHGNGWQSVYAHLDTFAKYCGDNVEQGEIIATLGTTGNSSGPHLHFELRNEQYGAVNPWNFLER